jgi:hypothetical protein
VKPWLRGLIKVSAHSSVVVVLALLVVSTVVVAGWRLVFKAGVLLLSPEARLTLAPGLALGLARAPAPAPVPSAVPTLEAPIIAPFEVLVVVPFVRSSVIKRISSAPLLVSVAIVHSSGLELSATGIARVVVHRGGAIVRLPEVPVPGGRVHSRIRKRALVIVILRRILVLLLEFSLPLLLRQITVNREWCKVWLPVESVGGVGRV